MCSLIVATGVFEQPGLFVVANRDEALDRPTEVPSVHHRREMKILAPRDLKAGGTWLGLNAAGVFAGITNRFRRPTLPHHKSRGWIVFQALQEASAGDAAAVIAELDSGDYNGFHLVVADINEARVVWNDGTSMQRELFDPGYHVITERSFGAAPSKRLDRMQRRLRGLPAWSEQSEAQILKWMAEHDESDPLAGTCVHLEDHNYGTRSSTIVELGDTSRFSHASGSPCVAEYQDYRQELDKLLAAR